MRDVENHTMIALVRNLDRASDKKSFLSLSCFMFHQGGSCSPAPRWTHRVFELFSGLGRNIYVVSISNSTRRDSLPCCTIY